MNSYNYLTYFKPMNDLKSSLDSKVKFYLYDLEKECFTIETFSVKYSIPSYYVKDCEKVIRSVNNLKKDYEKFLSFYLENQKDLYYAQKKAFIDEDIKLIKLKDSTYFKFLLLLPNLPRQIIEKNLKGIFQIHNSYNEFLRYYLGYPLSKIIIRNEQWLNYKYFYFENFDETDYKVLNKLNSLAVNTSFNDSIKISFYDGKQYVEFSTKARNDEHFFQEVMNYYNKMNPFFIYTYNFPLFYESLNMNEANMLKFGINNENVTYYSKSGKLKFYSIPGRIDVDLFYMKNFLHFELPNLELNQKDKTIAIFEEAEKIKDDLIYLSKLYNLLPNQLAFKGEKRRVSDFFMKQGYFKKNYPKVKPYNEYSFLNKEPIFFRDFNQYEFLQKLRNNRIIFKPGLYYGDVVNFYPLQSVFNEFISVDKSKAKNKEVIRNELENIASYVFFMFLFQPEKARKEFELKLKEKINQKNYIDEYLNRIKNKMNSLEGVINFNNQEYVFENFFRMINNEKNKGLIDEDFLPKYTSLVLSFDQGKYILANENKLKFRGFNLNNKTEYEKEMILSFLEDIMIKKDLNAAFLNLDFKIQNIYNPSFIQKFYHKKTLQSDEVEKFLQENSFFFEDYKIEGDEVKVIYYLLKKDQFLKDFYSSTNILNKILESLGVDNLNSLHNIKYLKEVIFSLYNSLKQSESLKLF